MIALTREELEQLLTTAKKHSKRDHLMILIAYWHGLRATELVTLETSNFTDGYIYVARRKDSLATRQILIANDNPILDEKTAVEEYLKILPEQAKLFPLTRQSFWYIMQKYGAEAGIPKHKRHPHVLKHSICKHTIKDVGLDITKQWVGHKAISSTASYLKTDDEEAGIAIQAASKKRKI